MKKEINYESYDWRQCECYDCTGDENAEPPQMKTAVSHEPTPWAIICAIHKQVFLTNHEYHRQMRSASSLWVCPMCPEFQIGTRFDDENFDNANEKLEEAYFADAFPGELKPNG